MQDLSVIRSPQDICFQELPHRSKARMYNVHSHYAQLRFISVTLHCLWATFGWSLMAIVSADPSLYTRVGFHCMPPQSQARGIQSYDSAHNNYQAAGLAVGLYVKLTAVAPLNSCTPHGPTHDKRQNCILQTTKQPNCKQPKPPTYCSHQWFGKMPRMHFRFYILTLKSTIQDLLGLMTCAG